MLPGCPHHLTCSPPTEGLLTLRAKPPTEAEYTDVLQKIKYAFSLLVRMQPLAGHRWGEDTVTLTSYECEMTSLPSRPGCAATSPTPPLQSCYTFCLDLYKW